MKIKKLSIINKIILISLVMLLNLGISSFAAENGIVATDAKNAKPPLNVDLNSDTLEYHPETNEFVASGNAELFVRDEDSKLVADTITYNQEANTVVAVGHVKMLKAGAVMYGDYTKFDLTKNQALISKPYSTLQNMKISAKTATLYPNKIDAFDGRATINNENVGFWLSTSSSGRMGGNNTAMFVDTPTHPPLQAEVWENNKSSYHVKSKEIILKGGKERNVLILKQATISIGKYKVAKVPYMEMSADKENQNLETMLPEFGHNQQMGGYIGPSHVFYLPNASLKVSPLFTFASGDYGIGGLARYTSKTNRTEIGYSTIKDKFVMNGKQDITDSTYVAYGTNSYVDNGMFGAYLSDLSADLIHKDQYLLDDINAKLDLRHSVGYAEDWERSWGTMRFKTQGSLISNKPIWSLKDYIQFRMQTQYDVTTYGNGTTTALVRLGPVLTWNYKRLYLMTAYYQGGVHGSSPMNFDRYMHGKSNAVVRASYNFSPYADVSYLGSYNLTKDNWQHKMMTENQFYASIGPKDIKVRLGYDTIRKRTLFNVDVLVGKGKSDIDFDKLKVIDPKKLGKSKTEDTKKTKNQNL